LRLLTWSVSLQSETGRRDEFYLKEMYLPASAAQKPAAEQDLIDVVFVHGLNGNLRTTWKQEGTKEPWFTKREFLSPLEDELRILSFGYNADPLNNEATGRVADHANDLLRNLVQKRMDAPDRPIIFIAHSLGGLVVKRAVLLSAGQPDWVPIKNATQGIVFLGTPHQGSDKANDLAVLQKIVNVAKGQLSFHKGISDELRPYSTAVEDLSREFTYHVYGSMELLCCYEAHKQKVHALSKEVVRDPLSALLIGSVACWLCRLLVLSQLTCIDCAQIVRGAAWRTASEAGMHAHRIAQVCIAFTATLRVVLGRDQADRAQCAK
jgi:pimeloyl-ACP methyl ester carboxylesterase